MTSDTIVFLLLGATAGGFINGLSGTGTALFALGFYLVVLEPVTAVAIVALMSVLAGAQGIWLVRREIPSQRARILRFALPGLIGVPIGITLLARMEPSVLRLGIAALLILYGGYFSFRTALPAFDRPAPFADVAVAFTGGVLGGAAGVSGALPAMWISMRPWAKTVTRAVLQSFNMVILSATVALLAWNGAYDNAALSALLVTVPAGLASAQVGIAVFKRLSDTQFRRLLIFLTLAMGLGILVSDVL